MCDRWGGAFIRGWNYIRGRGGAHVEAGLTWGEAHVGWGSRGGGINRVQEFK